LSTNIKADGPAGQGGVREGDEGGDAAQRRARADAAPEDVVTVDAAAPKDAGLDAAMKLDAGADATVADAGSEASVGDATVADAGTPDDAVADVTVADVAVIDGATWVNDSIATAPERVMAALRSYDEPIVLLAGGRDKNLPWGDLAKLICERVDHVVVFGEAGGMIQKTVAAVGGERSVDMRSAQTLKEAVTLAAEVASAGDVILLSPGGTSFDEFKDFAERGESFRKWVQELS